MRPSGRSLYVRDAVASTVGIGGCYGMFEFVPIRPLVVPGYLLVVGFDLLESVFGSTGSFYALLFGLYILGLGLVGGLLAHGVRTVAETTAVPPWRLGLAGGFSVVASLAFLFAAFVYRNTTQSEPVMIAGLVGIVLVGLTVLLSVGPRVVSSLRSA